MYWLASSLTDFSTTARSTSSVAHAAVPTACLVRGLATCPPCAADSSVVLLLSLPCAYGSSLPDFLDGTMSNHADEHAFDLKFISRLYDDRLHGRIRRMQFDMSRLLHIGFHGGLAVHQRHDGLTVLRRLLFANDNEIPGKNAFVFHRLALHTQSEGLSTLEHAGRHVDEFGLLHRFNRKPRGDNAGHWNFRHPAKPIDRHLDHAGDPSHPGLIPRNRDSGRAKRNGELLLGQSQLLSNAFEIVWLHDVTNGYTGIATLSSPILRPFIMVSKTAVRRGSVHNS